MKRALKRSEANKIFANQLAQGNLPNLKVFKKHYNIDDSEGGFCWAATEEGRDFWAELLKQIDFYLPLEEDVAATKEVWDTLAKEPCSTAPITIHDIEIKAGMLLISNKHVGYKVLVFPIKSIDDEAGQLAVMYFENFERAGWDYLETFMSSYSVNEIYDLSVTAHPKFIFDLEYREKLYPKPKQYTKEELVKLLGHDFEIVEAK